MIGAAALGSVCFILGRESSPIQLVNSADSEYVDPATCNGCHQDIAKTYRATGMGRSFYRPDSNTFSKDITRGIFYHRASDRYYQMYEREGKLYQRRHQIGFDGKEANIVEKQIDFVIGSGNHARTYLHRTPEGRLLELPLSWYSEKGGYFAMSPGYDHPDQEDFRRPISYDCMFCHNGYPEVKNSAGAPVYGSRMPQGIDCQRCHGPGRAHVTAAGSGHAAPEAIRQAILNPARLNRDRQLELCMQCHLETTSSKLPGSIRRYGRQVFSYRPGEPLANYILHFDTIGGSSNDKFEIAHAAYRLRKSACFRASQMTCLTCHNPHQVPRGQEAVQHYVAVCRSCHAAAHAATSAKALAGSSCLDCHMPKRRADDAVHVVVTDHFIQRLKPARDLLAPLQEKAAAYRGEVKPYYPPQFPQTPDGNLYLAVAQVQDGSNLKSGIPRLQHAIESNKPKEPEFYFELGRAYAKAGNHREAIRWFNETLHHAEDFPRARKELALSLVAAGRLSEATEILEKLAVTAPDTDILTNLANVCLREGQPGRADQFAQAALNIDPELPEAHNLLGLARLQKGDRAGAKESFRNAITAQPDLAIAHNNLANLQAGNREYRQAQYHFEKAIAIDPGYAEAHHSLGLLLELTQSYDKALAELQETVRLNPKLAEVHSEVADLLAAQGKMADAKEEYRKAIQLKPDLYEAHLAFGLLLAREGSAAEAREHFDKAAQSTDPEVRQGALQARGH